MSNNITVLLILALILGTLVGVLIWMGKKEDREANLPSAKKVRKLETLVNEANVIFNLMTSPTDLEEFDILTEGTKANIENWRKTHRRLDA